MDLFNVHLKGLIGGSLLKYCILFNNNGSIGLKGKGNSSSTISSAQLEIGNRETCSCMSHCLFHVVHSMA